LVSLAIIDWNSSKAPDTLESDREIHQQNSDVRLEKAHSIAPTNEVVAVTIADRLFKRGDHAKAGEIAGFVIKNGTTTRAEAYGIKGLVEQIGLKYDDALKSFEGARKEGAGGTGVMYGLGQMYTLTGDYPKAVDAYKTILDKEPDNYESLKRLASVYSMMDEGRDNAIECFDKLRGLLREYKEEDAGKSPGWGKSPKKVGKKDVGSISDPEILIEYGQVHEATDIQVTLACELIVANV
jgi:tetratricopeptide (TPR) repeat protein